MTMGQVRLWLDLFPARVTVQSSSISGVRAVVTDDALLVFRLGPGGAEVAAQYPVDGSALRGSPNVGYDIDAGELGVVYVDRTGGCGCGSRLRSADLFPGEQKVLVSR